VSAPRRYGRGQPKHGEHWAPTGSGIRRRVRGRGILADAKGAGQLAADSLLAAASCVYGMSNPGMSPQKVTVIADHCATAAVWAQVK
jgi:hypothetical protein